MKNYFKKFSIMLIMLLAVLGIGTIQNGNVANAATVGQQLTQPEDGWKRYDDTDSKIQYSKSLLILQMVDAIMKLCITPQINQMVL